VSSNTCEVGLIVLRSPTALFLGHANFCDNSVNMLLAMVSGCPLSRRSIIITVPYRLQTCSTVLTATHRSCGISLLFPNRPGGQTPQPIFMETMWFCTKTCRFAVKIATFSVFRTYDSRPENCENLPHFYRAMLAQSAVMRLHVVRLSVCTSVCPSVTIRYRDQIGWHSSKVISRPNSLRPMGSLTPKMDDLVQREHPQN